MAENRPESISYIRAFRQVMPSESMVSFLRHTGQVLASYDFEDDDPMRQPRVYALNSLRITLFERRAHQGQDNDEALSRLHAIMAQPKITLTERRRTRPGVLETVSRRVPNPLVNALARVATYYLQDGEDVDGVAKLALRASEIVESTEDDYREAGTELALQLDQNSGYQALAAQREVIDERAKGLNAGKRLLRPQLQDAPLAIPFMVAPFETEGQRDEFIDSLMTHAPMILPVYGNEAGPIQWQLKT